MSISYTKTNWQDLPVKTTPLSAANLNKIENGIADSVDGVNSNSHSIAELQTRISQIANGSPTPVATVAEMTDESAVYLYTGSETGYTAGNWYFWNGSAWTSGGTYGGAVTDTTLSISGAAADAKTVGDALADKADSDDVTSLNTRVTRVESDVLDLSSDRYEVYLNSDSGLVLLPVNNGDSITISTVDGSDFTKFDQLRFYQADGTYIRYYGVAPSYGSSRTVTADMTAKAEYVSIGRVGEGVVDYHVVNNTSASVHCGKVVKDLRSQVEKLSISKNMFGGKLDHFYPVYIPAGDSVTWSLSDGSELALNSFNVYFYDKDKNQLSYYVSTNISGRTSRTVAPSTTADTYYIKVLKSTATYPTASIQIELGDSASAFVPYFPNAKENGINIDGILGGMPACKSLSVNASTSHSSNSDLMPFAVSAGEEYIVYIETSGIDGRVVELFEKTATTAVSKGRVNANTFYTFTSTDGATDLSLFVSSGQTAVSMTLYAAHKDSFDGLICDLIEDATKYDTGLKTSNFSINAGSTHSSTLHRIELAVSAGEYYYMYCAGLKGRSATFFVKDGESTLQIIAYDGQYVCEKARDGVTDIGVYVGSGTTAVSITFIAFKADTVFAAIVSEYDRQYLARLANSKRKANPGSYRTLTTPEIFTLAHFSDIHNSAWAMKQVQRFKDTFGDQLDDVLCTGDLVSDKLSDGLAFWNNNSDGSILICIGNHDSLGSDGWSNPVSQADLYDTYIAPYKDNWNATTVTDHSYWYKDYADKKIRLIVVDATIYDSTEQAAQMTWFASALDGAKTNGYSVIGAVHFPPMPATYHKIDSNFTALLHGTAGDMSQFAWHVYDTDFLDAVDAFIDGGGDFVCWLSGHTHWDTISYDTRYTNQLFVTITCAMPVGNNDERNRDVKTGNGFVLNTVCVDTARKYIKLLRYGSEWDDCLRHVGNCVINYGTSPATIVYQN